MTRVASKQVELWLFLLAFSSVSVSLRRVLPCYSGRS